MGEEDTFVVAINVDNVAENSVGVIISGEPQTEHVAKFLSNSEQVKCQPGTTKILDIKKTGKKEWTKSEKDDGKCTDCGEACNCYDMKICDRCYILKRRIIDFSLNQNSKFQKTYRPSCKECRKIKDGVNMPASEKRIADRIAPSGIWECPICLKKIIVGIVGKPVRDHDHSTGKFRGWICDTCNSGLGRWNDNPKILRRAIEFLEKSFEEK